MDEFTVGLVALSDVPVHPVLGTIRADWIRKRGPAVVEKRFPPVEWQRISYAWSRLAPGESVLDVGVGQGAMSNLLALTGKFARVSGIDIRDYSFFERMSDRLDTRKMDGTRMDFADGSFDAVVCMEVLEHIDDDGFERMLAELRRVCRGQLLMAVPFLEPLPLPHYHLQRFTPQTIQRYFPHARKTLLMRDGLRKWPWVMLEEDRSSVRTGSR